MSYNRLFHRFLVGGTLALIASQAQALSISPMTEIKKTFTDRQGQSVMVTNGFDTQETMIVEGYEPDLKTPAEGMKIMPATFSLAPGAKRRVKIIYNVEGAEREIAICARPKVEDSFVVPRVCGRYLSRRFGKNVPAEAETDTGTDTE